jgi:hypothetical protein
MLSLPLRAGISYGTKINRINAMVKSNSCSLLGIALHSHQSFGLLQQAKMSVMLFSLFSVLCN